MPRWALVPPEATYTSVCPPSYDAAHARCGNFSRQLPGKLLHHLRLTLALVVQMTVEEPRSHHCLPRRQTGRARGAAPRL